MKKINQKGLADFIILGVVIVAVGGFITYRYFETKNTDVELNSQATTNSQQTEAQQETEQIPEGWERREDSETSISYAANADWPNTFELEEFSVDEEIPVGYGQPTSVRFNSAKQQWQTVDPTDNNKELENIVSKTDSLVTESNSTVSYETGDGAGGQLRLLINQSEIVYQIAFPRIAIKGLADEPSEFQIEDYKQTLDDFIANIVLP